MTIGEMEYGMQASELSDGERLQRVARVVVAEGDAALVEQLVDGLGQLVLGQRRQVALGDHEHVGQRLAACGRRGRPRRGRPTRRPRRRRPSVGE